MHTHIRWRRARAVVHTAVQAYRRKAYPYQNEFLPQDILPADIRADPLITARILFYSCHYMRGTIRSDYAMQCMVRLYRERPEFFDPSSMADTPVEEIRAVLGTLLPYKKDEIARSWKENSKRLSFHWHGDPRTIFTVAKNPDDMYRFVTNRNSSRIKSRGNTLVEDGFLGFQEKMASMLAYFLESCELIKPFKKEAVPPVDFHHLRILIATESIVLADNATRARYEKLRPIGGYLYEVLMRRMGVGMRELGDALWVISNRLCSASPVTQTLNGNVVIPDWSSPAVVRSYGKTCGACPLKHLCRKAVRADVYYQQGYFELDRPRLSPPHIELPLDMPHVFPKRQKSSPGR